MESYSGITCEEQNDLIAQRFRTPISDHTTCYVITQCCELEYFFVSLTQERKSATAKFIELFVLPTLQFFTFI